jgi:hypothetical protein
MNIYYFNLYVSRRWVEEDVLAGRMLSLLPSLIMCLIPDKYVQMACCQVVSVEYTLTDRAIKLHYLPGMLLADVASN